MDTRLIEHRRVPYAIGLGARVVSPEQALHAAGALKCPQCGCRVALTSVAASLAFAHVRPVATCALSRKGKGWVKPAAVHALYAIIREAAEAPPGMEPPLLRKCYTCLSLRPDALPGGSKTVVMDYDPQREAPFVKPDVTVLGSNGHLAAAFFVSAGERLEVPERMRRFPSMIVDAEDVLLASGPLKVSRSYGMHSPQCPCDKADRIPAAGDPPSVPCPKRLESGIREPLPLAECCGCQYHLSEYKSEVTCGYTQRIRRKYRHQPRQGSRAIG